MDNCMDNYIVRIYRREGKGSKKIIGIVEQVGAKERLAFQNIDELWAILNKRRGRHKGKGIVSFPA